MCVVYIVYARVKTKKFPDKNLLYYCSCDIYIPSDVFGVQANVM